MQRIRASSLSELHDCPARWASKYIDGRTLPSSGKAALGTAVHASTAAYDQSVIDGSGLSIDDAAAAAVEAIWNPQYDVQWGEDSPQKAEEVALSLHIRYCQEVAPLITYAAVEAKTDDLLIQDIGLCLTGTVDRIYKDEAGKLGIADIKTGKVAVGADGTIATAGHAYQLGVYELLAQHTTGQPIEAPAKIIGMNTAKTAQGQRVGFGEITGAREVLLGTEEEPGILFYAAEIIHSGLFFGNPKSMLCHASYCPNFGPCRFRK